MQTIQDGESWVTAQTANSVDSYQQYIAAEPNGADVQEAHNQIMALQRWQDAKNAGTSTALQDFLQKYPQGTEADQARAQLRSSITRCSSAPTAVASRPTAPAPSAGQVRQGSAERRGSAPERQEQGVSRGLGGYDSESGQGCLRDAEEIASAL